MSAKPTELRAVIVAAGRGARFGGNIPKQFEMLGAVPVALHSVRFFTKLAGMKEVILVLPPGGWPIGSESVAAFFDQPLDVPLRQIEGGPRRQDSVARGLEACGANPNQIILVHDAARPFPALAGVQELVCRVQDESRLNKQFGGGLLAIPATDTIKRTRADGTIIETLDRSTLWLAQTPQAIVGSHLAAVREALSSPKEFTDESAVLESLGLTSIVVSGSPNNFKITHSNDMERARQILNSA